MRAAGAAAGDLGRGDDLSWCSGLLRSANSYDLPPAAWEEPIRFLDLGLTFAFVVLMVTSVVTPRRPRHRDLR